MEKTKRRTVARAIGAIITAATLLAAIYATAAPMIPNDPRGF